MVAECSYSAVAHALQRARAVQGARKSIEMRAEELKRYVRFSADHARLLAEARNDVEPAFRPIADEFYERIREHAEAHDVFANEAQIDRLKTSLVRWLEGLFGGTYDEFLAKEGREHAGRG